MSDTDVTTKVAEKTGKVARVERENPRMYGFVLDMTEAEGKAIEALRVWDAANDDPALMRELDAWEILRLEVGFYREGRYNYSSAVQSVGKEEDPTRFAAVVTISHLLSVFGGEPVGAVEEKGVPF
jgi:hypothetical protein